MVETPPEPLDPLSEEFALTEKDFLDGELVLVNYTNTSEVLQKRIKPRALRALDESLVDPDPRIRLSAANSALDRTGVTPRVNLQQAQQVVLNLNPALFNDLRSLRRVEDPSKGKKE
jgi:hypothetical protein